MLRLKLKVGQSVRIARTFDLTVMRLGIGDALLRQHVQGDSTWRATDHFLRTADPLLLVLDTGDEVRVLLTAVSRGEAHLGFDAKREIAIERR